MDDINNKIRQEWESIAQDELAQATAQNINIVSNVNKLPSPTVQNPLWLSVSEAANIGGVSDKTLRRAIQSKLLSYKIIKARYYMIELASLVRFLNSQKKLKNKFMQHGIGQYVEKWL